MTNQNFNKVYNKRISLQEFNNSEIINMHIFAGCEIDFSEFFEFELENVVLYKCMIEENDLSGLRAKTVKIVECNLIGNLMVGSRLEDVVLEDCLVLANSFASSQFKNVSFVNCDIGLNGFRELQYENLEGIRLETVTDSHGRFLVFDRDSEYVFHTLFSGQIGMIRSLLEYDRIHVSGSYREELYNLICKVGGNHDVS